MCLVWGGLVLMIARLCQIPIFFFNKPKTTIPKSFFYSILNFTRMYLIHTTYVALALFLSSLIWANYHVYRLLFIVYCIEKIDV